MCRQYATSSIGPVESSVVLIRSHTRTASSAQLVSVGLEAFGKAKWDLIEPLLDEMMSCVQYVGNPEKSPDVKLAMSSVPDAIEEVTTLLTIRKELLELHLGFSLADRPQS